MTDVAVAGGGLIGLSVTWRAAQSGLPVTVVDDAIEVVPGVTELELVETLARWRPGTADNGPVLGASELPGLVMATGHHRNGVLLTPITGDVIAELLTTGTLPDRPGTGPCGQEHSKAKRDTDARPSQPPLNARSGCDTSCQLDWIFQDHGPSHVLLHRDNRLPASTAPSAVGKARASPAHALMGGPCGSRFRDAEVARRSCTESAERRTPAPLLAGTHDLVPLARGFRAPSRTGGDLVMR
jgi:hypothetical protein